MAARSVARSSSSSSTRSSATKAEKHATCSDCGEVMDVGPTGRPKVYCDATCRKNAARKRAWDQWREAENAWTARDAARKAAVVAAQAEWDAKPVPPMPSWASHALAAGWSPDVGWRTWDHQQKTEAYGPRPADYVTPPEDRRPECPGGYRSGKRGEGASYYW